MGRYFKVKLHCYSLVRTRVCLETKASANEEFKPGFEGIRRDGKFKTNFVSCSSRKINLSQNSEIPILHFCTSMSLTNANCLKVLICDD